MHGPLPRAALVALLLAALAVSAGCYARRSIPSDPPEAQGSRARAVRMQEPDAAQPTPAAPAPAEAQVQPAPTTATPAQPATATPPDAKAVPVQTTQAKAAPAQPVAAAQANATEAQPHAYMVQVGSFSTEKNAEGVLSWLKAKGYAGARMARLEQGGAVFHRVQAGPFQDLAAARKALEELKPDWPQAFIPAD